MQVAVNVNGEQVDDLVVRRVDLATYHQQRIPEDRRILLQKVLELRFGRHFGGLELLRRTLIDAPHSHLYRHNWLLKLACHHESVTIGSPVRPCVPTTVPARTCDCTRRPPPDRPTRTRPVRTGHHRNHPLGAATVES